MNVAIDTYLTLAGLIVLSAFFSGSETALMSLSEVKVRHLVEKKKFASGTLAKLKKHPHRMLVTILIGNNVVNIAASVIATMIALDLFKSNVIAYSTGIMTLIVLVFGEFTPKNLANTYTEKMALMVAKPIYWLGIILYPIIIVFDGLNYLTGKILGSKPAPPVTEEEIKTIVNVGEEAGEIEEAEKELIHKIFRFNDTSAAEIMTPRPDIIAVNGDSLLKDKIGYLIKSHHTRIPVYEKTRDKIIGVLLQREVLRALKNKKDNQKVRKFMRSVFFIPGSIKVDVLLRQFQKRKEHMAVVVDEHGVVSGVVTIEDVLEEIVGEIVDETDKVEPHIVKTDKKTWVVLGKTEVEEINEKLKLDIKEDEDFETLSGFVLHHSKKIPKAGAEIKLETCTMKVLKMAGQRVEKVLVRK